MMANAGTFRNGEKRPNQGKRGPDKIQTDLRTMVLCALDAAGGSAYLQAQAAENPGAFLALVGKCLPKDVILTSQTVLNVELVRRG